MRPAARAAFAAVCLVSLRASADDGWAKRCQAIFNTARAELTTQDPTFARGVVKLDARAGKTRSPITADEAKRPLVSYALGALAAGRQPLYLATVSTAAGVDVDVDHWSSIPNKAYSGFDLRERRTQKTRVAFIGGRDVKLSRLQGFIERFRRAADDCLAAR